MHGMAAIAKPLIVESNAQMHKDSVTTMKPGHETTEMCA
jgi:hypothetical protein